MSRTTAFLNTLLFSSLLAAASACSSQPAETFECADEDCTYVVANDDTMGYLTAIAYAEGSVISPTDEASSDPLTAGEYKAGQTVEGYEPAPYGGPPGDGVIGGVFAEDYFGGFIVDPKPHDDERDFPEGRVAQFPLEDGGDALLSVSLYRDATFEISVAECDEAICSEPAVVDGDFTVEGETIVLEDMASARPIKVGEREGLEFQFNADAVSPTLRGVRYALVMR